MPFDKSESTTPPSGGPLAPPVAVHKAERLPQPSQEAGGLLLSASSAEATPASQSIIPMLLRQKWLIGSICLTVCALAIPPVWIFIKPTYQSTAVVRVSPVVSRIVFKTEDNGIVPLYQSFLNTQISLIRDPRVLERVLDRKDVQQTAWYAAERRPLWGDLIPRLNRLRDDLKVQVRPQTELIDVSISTLKAADAQVIVNAVVDEYQTISDNEEKNRDSTRIETLKAERSDRERVTAGLRDQKFILLRQTGAIDTEQRRAQLGEDLGRLEFESAEVERNLGVIRWQLARLSPAATRPSVAESGPATASAPALFTDGWYFYDAEWRARDLEVKKARYEIERATETLGEAHPRMKDLQALLRFAEQLRTEREEQLRANGQVARADGSTGIQSMAGPGDRAALEVLAQEHEQKLKLLEEDMKQLRDELKEAGEVSRQMADIDAKITKNSEISGAIAARIEELQVEGKGPARIQIASHGLLPAEPARDRRILMTLAALIGGLLAGMTCAYFRGTADTTIREAGDVRRTLQTPFLGQVCQSPSPVDPKATSSSVTARPR